MERDRNPECSGELSGDEASKSKVRARAVVEGGKAHEAVPAFVSNSMPDEEPEDAADRRVAKAALAAAPRCRLSTAKATRRAHVPLGSTIGFTRVAARRAE